MHKLLEYQRFINFLFENSLNLFSSQLNDSVILVLTDLYKALLT